MPQRVQKPQTRTRQTVYMLTLVAVVDIHQLYPPAIVLSLSVSLSCPSKSINSRNIYFPRRYRVYRARLSVNITCFG